MVDLTERASGPAASPEALLEMLQRERADFLNYKRRVEREREADREAARADAVLGLLPVLDDLDRALGGAPADLADHPWARGVALCGQQLQKALAGLGVERVGAVGEEFDPARHEAVQYEPRGDVEPGRVAAVHRAGYRMGDRLLRPAQVTVAAPPAEQPKRRRSRAKAKG